MRSWSSGLRAAARYFFIAPKDLMPPRHRRLSLAFPQSTYCHQVHEHCASIGRTVHIVNLDPAADHFERVPPSPLLASHPWPVAQPPLAPPQAGIPCPWTSAASWMQRHLHPPRRCSQSRNPQAPTARHNPPQNVMEELELGPNGALLYSMEYLVRPP